MKKITAIIILLILMGTATASADFVNNNDGTITDTATGLMWQQATQTFKTWESAVVSCESLVLALKDDWRLPNINELQTLVDYTRQNPSIDTIFFPDTESRYWSSTTSVVNPGNAWRVDFFAGRIKDSDKGNYYYVRAVRGGGAPWNCPSCSENSKVIENMTFPFGCDCICTTGATITLGPNVTLENGAKVRLNSPVITIIPEVTIKQGADFKTGL